MRGGKRWRSHRLLVLACLLSVLVGDSAGLAVSAEPAGRDSTRVLLAANRFERLVTDLETGQLGYIATGDAEALTPWHAARAVFPRQAALLERLAAENSPEQGRRAREIVRAVTSYLHEHAEPLVRSARSGHARARSAVRRAEGKRRIDAIRHQFDRFTEVQHRLAVAAERDAVPATRRVIATAAGTSGSLLLVFLLVGYVMRARDRSAQVAGPVGPEAGPESPRRLATLVDEGASPAGSFSLVAGELGRAVDAAHTLVCQYEDDGTATVVGHWSAAGTTVAMPPLEGRWPVEDETVADLVYRTGRPAHLRADLPAVGRIGAWIRSNGIRRMTGCPIVAGDRLWGMAAVLSGSPDPWPAGTTRTVEEYAGLLGIVVSHARRRTELAASRVRLVEASDAARRRLERVLHKRTQQRLVTVGLELRAVEATVPPELAQLRERVSVAARSVAEIVNELQAVARELHPTFLSRSGIGPALHTLARRSPVPVELDVRSSSRPPENVAITVYYVVSEALTNAATHAGTSVVQVVLDLGDPVRLWIHDDGAGGTALRTGSALGGLKDRTEALGGSFELESRAGGGTTIRVTLPLNGGPSGEVSAP